ncbi:MAG: hypothetical protein DWP98_03990 [Bacteroidetes bacterium]|nr:MAG: hypothetical protein DWP98_03990 [Bacteroidota bacterium]MBL1143388.1 hypothetical protein [Bacteroidota bacterium]NOG56191.1 hypothetical protein [Bacteroidota bacterium]
MRVFFLLSLIVVFASCQQHSTAEKVSQEIEILINKQVSPTHSSLRGISVLSEELAWLSGAKGSIIRTKDAGAHWELLPSPDQDSLDFRDVEAFSSDEAIVISAGFPSRIYKTYDAGAHWKLVHENYDSAAFMNSIAFKNKQEGIVFGDVLGGSHLILITKNGGETWERIPAEKLPKPLEIENGFAASGSCIAIDDNGNYFIALGGEEVRVFHSKDGDLWTASKTPMYAGDASIGAYSIAFGKGQLIAVGGDYLEPDSTRIPISSTDGMNWKKTLEPVNGFRSVIDFSEKENCWLAGGTNGIDLSTDSGETWNSITSENVNTLQFAPNSSKAYAGTKDGNVFLIEIMNNQKQD